MIIINMKIHVLLFFVTLGKPDHIDDKLSEGPAIISSPAITS